MSVFDHAEKSFILAGSQDPTVTATKGRKGALFFQANATGGAVYQKQDDGMTTNWTQVIKSSAIPGATTNSAAVFYVRINGDDATGDGSLAKPFATIDAAIAATAGITLDQGYGPGVLDLDATWEINVGPGSFPCDTPMKNFVYLKGAGWQNTFVFPNINPTNTWDCVDAPGTEARFGATGIQFVAGFEMIRPTGSVEPARARFFGCLFSSNSTFTGSGTGQDAVSFNECEMFGSVITYGAIGVTHRNGSLGVSTFGDVGVDASFSGSNASLVHTTHRRITINDNALVVLRNSQLTSQNVVFNGTGGSCRTFDENSVPTSVAYNGGATAAQLVKNARVAGLGVNGNTGMTTAGNWVGAVPVDFNEALNRIIAVLVTLNAGPLA